MLNLKQAFQNNYGINYGNYPKQLRYMLSRQPSSYTDKRSQQRQTLEQPDETEDRGKSFRTAAEDRAVCRVPNGRWWSQRPRKRWIVCGCLAANRPQRSWLQDEQQRNRNHGMLVKCSRFERFYWNFSPPPRFLLLKEKSKSTVLNRINSACKFCSLCKYSVVFFVTKHLKEIPKIGTTKLTLLLTNVNVFTSHEDTRSIEGSLHVNTS